MSFSLELRNAINLAVTMIDDIEAIRAELNEIIPLLKNKQDTKSRRT